MEETISLKEIFGVIKKRLLLIISLIVAAALVSAIVTFFVLTPKYEASSQFIVNQSQEKTKDSEYSINVQTSQKLISTYNVIIKSPAILENVVNDLNLDISASQLQNKLNVASAENSQVVTVTVTDSDPLLAQQIANTTVSVFQKKIPDIMSVDNVSILSKADVGNTPAPVSPKPMLNIAIAIVLGGMIGVGLAFLLEYLDNTIKTESDIEDKLGVPILGIITHIDDNDIRPDDFQAAAVSRRKRGGLSGSQKRSI